jgi:hypothetical protein
MFKDLIEYDELYEASAEMFSFGDVTFLRDFGPYKKGDNIPIICFLLDTGMVETFLSDGITKANEFKFKLEA